MYVDSKILAVALGSLLVGGAVASSAAYLVMQRIGRLPTEGRSLR